jgi:hypothetical protein
MALTKDPTGKAAPSGGFQRGGWYSGYQYWDGSFASSAGQIHPSSNQQGAGQAVSAEVNRASSVAAGESPNAYQEWIDKQNQTSTAKPPTSSDQVTPYLNEFQNEVYQTKVNPEQRMTELKTQLAPTTPAPTTLNRVEEFEKLRTTQGVADLEKTLTDLKAQEDQLYAERRQQKTAERGKTVPMGVIEGRISEEERTYLERVDYLGRQVARTTDELNTKYNVINTYINYMGLDYQDAVAAYDKEYAINFKVYDLVKGEQAAERSAYEYDTTAAKANLQIMMNAITNGNISYSNLSANDKLAIQKLEIQAGFPVGTMSNLQMSPKDKILAFSEDKTQAIVVGADGGFTTISTGLQPSGGSAITATTNALKNFVMQKHTLAETFAKFGDTIAPNTIYKTYNDYSPWGEATETAAQLKDKYNVTLDTVTTANVNKAKQLIMQNGGSDEDLKKAETDPDFVNWIIANY